MPFDLKGKNEKQLVSIVVEKETVSCEHIERFFFIVAAIFITLTVCQSIQLANSNSQLFFTPPIVVWYMRIVYLVFLVCLYYCAS